MIVVTAGPTPRPSCSIPPAPPRDVAGPTPRRLPAGTHDAATAVLNQHLATGVPAMGGWTVIDVDGTLLVAQVTRHTTCNGTPNTCCPAVSVFSYLGSEPTERKTSWPIVIATGVAAGALILAFRAAIAHASRRTA